MKICIIGTGYVGLVAGAGFAETGHSVICVDHDTQKITDLQNGVIPIYEPGLEHLVKKNQKTKNLFFSTNLNSSIADAQIIFLAIGTPQNIDGSANLDYLYQACQNICDSIKNDLIIVVKSTVPVGTSDALELFFKERSRKKVTIVSNPEFLKEGDAINDFMKPDRIIIGTEDTSVMPLFEKLYTPFNLQKNRLIFMDRRSAELTKYAANAMLALRISFMNEISQLCDAVGANINDVRKGIGSDNRIGPAFLYAGIGFGGSCFPKDMMALLKTSQENNITLHTLQAAHQVNQHQVSFFFKKITHKLGISLKNKKLAVWGLAFKAKTDDIRESPALRLIDLLLEHQADVHVYDPEAMQNTKKIYQNKLHYHENKMGCLAKADGLIITTDWNEFRNPDFNEIKKQLKTAQIFDGRNLYNKQELLQMGFDYTGIGQ